MRHASDTLHGWARHLVIGDARAKSVLLSLCLYANHLAIAWPSISTLALDTEQSEATVRSRLRYLTDIGVIARLPRWSDDAGRRNADGMGRRTSDDIQLVTEATQDVIDAARAARKSRGAPQEPLDENSEEDIEIIEQTESIAMRGSNPAPLPQEGGRFESVNPRMNSHLKEESPLTPKGEWAHEKTWKRFEEAWVEPILHQKLCREIWGKLSDADREAAITAAAGYVAHRRAQRRPNPVCNAQKFLREPAAWPGYAARAPSGAGAVIPPPATYEPHSREGRAILALGRIGRYTPRCLSDGRVCFRGEINPQLLAFADIPSDAAEWLYRPGSANFGSWRDLIRKVFAGCNLPLLPEIRAPWPWPPNVKGSVYSGSDPPPFIEGSLMTEEDLEEMAKG
jgi:hypothetical protein